MLISNVSRVAFCDLAMAINVLDGRMPNGATARMLSSTRKEGDVGAVGVVSVDKVRGRKWIALLRSINFAPRKAALPSFQ